MGRRGDIAIHGLNGEDQFGLRWHRLLLPEADLPAVHIDPAANPFAVSAPIDLDSLSLADQPWTGFGWFQGVAESLPLQPVEDIAAGALFSLDAAPWPSFALEPDFADSAPPGGFIPKAEAVIWSGPAIVAFPGEPHDTPVSAGMPGLADGPDTAGPPELADAPEAVTRADLDPVLTAMAPTEDHAIPPDAGGTDLGSAFLPPDADHVIGHGHGLDPGFSFTQPPLPPPDLI